MKIVAYLMLSGNCEEALNFYKEVLNGEIVFLQRYKDAVGMPVADEDKEKVLHAQLEFGENKLYFSDSNKHQPLKVGNNVSLTLEFEDEGEQQRVFDLLAKDGQVQMPLEDQFWGAKFGSVIDKFGFYWSLNCNK
ncbi:VOC family protein [Wukongibacter baidiensis]|uniref:VOC family protein n=1 Tax=Wukongibacter baidiensis TaxID=1723361 RepID=UPI003D7F8281